ncbi:MAG: M28 family metallopeptidase, partial [Anaerolineaceae bacterium]|nr:M28 family metallopeptidase [Anaerolineaceae bacterium]
MPIFRHPRRLVCVFLLLLSVQLACNLPVQSVNPTGETAVIDDLYSRTSPEQWASWIRKLSGAEPVQIGGETTTITTRYSYAMFTGQDNARAFDFILEQVQGWVRPDQIEIDPYPYTDAEHTYTWKNIIVTFPGTTHADEVVILSAHFDSIVVREGDALQAAPGANDNGTGVATALEAVRLFSSYQFERTVKVIFFSGEELGLQGSRAYVEDHPTGNIVAVVNLDMFGYDSNGDRCIELHVGTLPGSESIGEAFLQVNQEYGLNLSFDFLTTQATDRSDHASFWAKGVPAILVIENFFDDQQPGGCQGVDPNP